MRVALVVPDRRDPAHAAVLRGLGTALRLRGHGVVGFSGHRGRAALAGALKRASCDIVHAHLFSRRWSGLGGLGAAGLAPLVVTHQGASLVLTDDRRALADLVRRARRVTVVSRAGLRELLQAFPAARRKSSVVANGTLPGPASRRRSGPDLLTVGRVAAYKGLDLLALAVSRLAEGGRKVRWTIVGPDQTGGRFAGLLSKLGLARCARLTGALPAARVRALMASCRVFVQPSRAENMPMALLEAMAAGAPVVAADVGGCREAVRAGREGLLVPPGDPDALAEALNRLLNDAAFRRRLGISARRRSRAFSWARAAAGYERAYEDARAGTRA